MRDKARSVLNGILQVINAGIILIYLLVCLVPYIDTGKYWLIAFPGLAFPLVFFALLCFVVFWAILRSKWCWISLFALLVGTQQILAVFSFHLPRNFVMVKATHTLRVFHWNVEGWDDAYESRYQAKHSYYSQMMQLLRIQNADVMCFEEYADKKDLQDSSSTASTIQRMGYPYYLFAATAADSHDNPKGVVIFSKYPFAGSDTISYGNHTQAEHLIYIDLKKDGRTFRIFTTHLQSVRFEPSDYESLSKLKHAKDPGYRDSRTILSKLKKGYVFRFRQAQVVRREIQQSPYPVVLTGDFNDVPNSNTYFTIRGKLQDSFLKKGSFIGRTFRFISPTLRIDYILADKRLKVTQFRTIHVPYSDHYPIETDLQY